MRIQIHPTTFNVHTVGQGLTTLTLDSANDQIAYLRKMPANKSISEIHVMTLALTGTAPTYEFAIQEVTAGSGDNPFPSGTDAATADVAAITASHVVSIASFGTPFALGSTSRTLAFVLRYRTGTIDVSNNVVGCVGNNEEYLTRSTIHNPFNLTTTDGGTTWVDSVGNVTGIAIKFSDGTWMPGSFVFNSNTSNSIVDLTANYVGTYWNPCVDHGIFGMHANFRDVGVGSTLNVRLFEDNIQIHSESFDGNKTLVANSQYILYFPFSTQQVARAGKAYRLTMDDGGSGTNRYQEIVFHDQIYRKLALGMTNLSQPYLFGEVQRTVSEDSGASWTELPDRLVSFSPMVDWINIGRPIYPGLRLG